MKKILFLLLCTVASYGQAVFDEGIQITGGQPTVTTTPHLTTTEANGVQAKITPENLPVSTATTNAIDLKTTLSAGAFSGFEVTNNGDGTINVGSGIAYLRATNDQYAPLIKYPIAAYNNIPLVDNMNNYILVSYNGGSPALVLNTTGSGIDTQTNSIAVAAARVGTTVHYVNLTGSNSDPNAKLRNRYLLQEGIRRISGLTISATGLKIATTSGITFSGLIRLDVSAIDTNAGGTYTLAYNNGSTWTRITGQTDINNTQYNNAGTLTTLSNNHFRTDYVYTLVNSPSKLYVILGTAEYGNLASAQAAPQPSSLPVELQQLGVIVGRVIVEKSATTLNVASPFTTTFTGATAQNHNDLAGLQGGTSGEYNHLTNAQVTLVNGSEQTTNKSDSYTVSSSTTYASTKAVVDGLATKINSSSFTTTPTSSAFTHYFGETASDGIIRPKTLANVRTEIVTTAAVDAAKANIITGTGTSRYMPVFTGTNTLGNSSIQDNSDTGNGIAMTFGLSSSRLYLNKGGASGLEIRAAANGLQDSGAGDNVNIVSLTGGLVNGTESYGGFKITTDVNFISSKLQFYTGSYTGSPTLRATIFSNGNFVYNNTTDNGKKFQITGTSSLDGEVTLPTAPTTSAGSYDILTRNSSTGVVEKVASNTYATLASPAFTGTPTAPTATAGTNTTQIATTAFVTGNFVDKANVQTISGLKTFSGGVYVDGLELSNSAGLDILAGSNFVNLKATTATAPRSVLLPDASGTIALVETVKPYKSYVALVSQSGTSAPTAIVLENTTGATVTFARSALGTYTATFSSSVLTLDKTTTILTNSYTDGIATSGRASDTVINIYTTKVNPSYAFSDDRLNKSTIEIRIYP